MRTKFNDLKTSKNIASPNDQKTYSRYMNEINKLKPLSREEEVELFKKLEENPNDQKIIEKLCKHNLLFVVAVAKRYFTILHNSTLTLEDLISEGNIGLCIAIKKFDYKKGNKFISYAVWWIRSYISKAIDENLKSIRIPSSVRKIMNKFTTAENDLEQKLGRKATTLEVFEAMCDDAKLSKNYQLNTLEDIIDMTRFEISLNSSVGPESSTELIDMLESPEPNLEEQYLKKERSQIAYKLIEDLPPIIRSYFVDFYGLDNDTPMSFKEIAEKHDESVRNIENRFNAHLKRIRKKNKLLKKSLFPTPNYGLIRKFNVDEESILI